MTLASGPISRRDGESSNGDHSNGDQEQGNRPVMIDLKPAAEAPEARATVVAESVLDFATKDALRPDLPEHRLTIEAPFEPPARRSLFFVLALMLCAVHLAFSQTYWAPAHYGNNQSAYLVAGKYLFTRGTTGFEPQSPFEFVGWMWNMAESNSTAEGGGWVYPKYPLGLPVLNGIAYTLGNTVGGMDYAVAWTFMISPISTTLAMLAVFLITRLVAGSFPAVLAMIMFATLTVVMVLMNNPYSHAADMAFVTWGIYMLLRWWQSGGWWRGAMAGFLLGYAATIRYTEGLLVLPLAAVIVASIRWTRLRSWLRVAVPALAWAAPLLVLVTFNYFTVGSITGYDSTNESTGFTLTEMARKWRWGVDQFYNTGLYIYLPLSVLGLVMAFRWNWRVALVLALWYVPGTLLYLSYYWGMNLPVWGFLRFFASTFPAGVILAAWVMQRAGRGEGDVSQTATDDLPQTNPRRRAIATLALFALVTLATVPLLNWAFNHSPFRLTAPVLLLSAAAGLVAAGLAVDAMPLRRRALLTVSLIAIVALGWFVTHTWLSRGWAGERMMVFQSLIVIGGAVLCAGAFGAGRGVAAPIAMGLLVAFPASINLDVSDSPLERDYTIASNLTHAGKQIRSAIKEDGAVVFADSQLVCNYLQFAGNYRLLGADYFRGGRPVPGIGGGPNNDNPNPIQPARKRFVDKLYEKYDRKGRMSHAAEVAAKAIDAGQKVYVVSEAAGAGSLADDLVKAAPLKSTEVATWVDPVKMSARAASSLGTIGRDGFSRREPWRWRIYEITRGSASDVLPPTTLPTTQPGE